MIRIMARVGLAALMLFSWLDLESQPEVYKHLAR